MKKTAFYTLGSGSGKPRIGLVLLLLWAGILHAAAAQAPQKVVIPSASQVVLTHLGIHTHANYLVFDTGSRDAVKMSQDPARFPHFKLRAFCRLPTDRAALPPDLAAFSSPGDPPLPNPYGPISGGPGKPGWTPLPIRQNGKNRVRVLVPTRFANWLALQTPARRRAYSQPQCYSLQITWG